MANKQETQVEILKALGVDTAQHEIFNRLPRADRAAITRLVKNSKGDLADAKKTWELAVFAHNHNAKEATPEQKKIAAAKAKEARQLANDRRAALAHPEPLNLQAARTFERLYGRLKDKWLIGAPYRISKSAVSHVKDGALTVGHLATTSTIEGASQAIKRTPGLVGSLARKAWPYAAVGLPLAAGVYYAGAHNEEIVDALSEGFEAVKDNLPDINIPGSTAA